MNPPNLLILYTDQQRHDALRCAGNPEIVTPHLDRLASQGVRFTRHFVNCPVCMPSRVSMLSGQYPHTLSIFTNGTPVPEDVVTLPRLLRNHGYYSANLGKLHFLNHANRDHREVHPTYGFDHLEISDEPGPYDDAYRAYVRRQMPDQLDHISAFVFPPAARQWREVLRPDDPVKHPDTWDAWTPKVFTGRDDATHTAFVGQRTIDFLQAHADASRPFLCIAGFYSPHSPLFAPQRYFDLYDRDALSTPSYPSSFEATRLEKGYTDEVLRAAKHGYYAMVSEVDAWVGRILEALDATGRADDTVVVFTSDHGEYLGDFARWGKGPPEDCSAGVPLLVRGVGPDRGVGGVCEGLVESVDIVPTLLELAGVPAPGFLQGESFAAAVRGEPFDGRDEVLIQQADWKALRSSTHRYVLHRDGRERLYDLAAPWGEYQDVADDPAHAATLHAMRHRLAVRLIASERPRPRTWQY